MIKRQSVLAGLGLSAAIVIAAAAVSFSCDENKTSTTSTASAASTKDAHCSSDAAKASMASKGDACCMSKSSMAAADQKTPVQATFAVTGVECNDCVKKIESAVKKVKGVKKYQVDREHNAVMVAYVPAKTDCEVIGAAITNAGFPATLHGVNAYDGNLACPAGMKEGCEKAGACPFDKKAKSTKSTTTSM